MRLVVKNLEIGCAGIVLLQRISFAVQPGTLLVVQGANGVGKTTLLRTIIGLHKINKGKIFIEYQGATYPPCLFAHYLGEKNAMKSHLSLIDNISFWAKFYAVPPKIWRPLFAEIGLVGLEHLPLHCLSTGQKRRLGFIRLLLQERPLWLLDEAHAGLDKTGRDFITQQMRQHMAKGGMIVATTHLPLDISPHQSLDLMHHQNDQQPC